MKSQLALVLAVLAAAAPAVAESTPHTSSGHMRPQLYHDRSPHIHNRGSQPHHQA